jgi:hypothetical protein
MGWAYGGAYGALLESEIKEMPGFKDLVTRHGRTLDYLYQGSPANPQGIPIYKDRLRRWLNDPPLPRNPDPVMVVVQLYGGKNTQKPRRSPSETQRAFCAEDPARS